MDLGYLRLLGGIWVNEDKGEFDWTLTDFLKLCVSTPGQMRCSFNGEGEIANAPVHIDFWVASKSFGERRGRWPMVAFYSRR